MQIPGHLLPPVGHGCRRGRLWNTEEPRASWMCMAEAGQGAELSLIPHLPITSHTRNSSLRFIIHTVRLIKFSLYFIASGLTCAKCSLNDSSLPCKVACTCCNSYKTFLPPSLVNSSAPGRLRLNVTSSVNLSQHLPGEQTILFLISNCTHDTQFQQPQVLVQDSASLHFLRVLIYWKPSSHLQN